MPNVIAVAAWRDNFGYEQGGSVSGLQHWGNSFHSQVTRFFESEEEAIQFKCTMPFPVRLIDVRDWFDPFWNDAWKCDHERRRFKAANVSLPQDYIDKLLSAMTPKKWHSEGDILELGERALTPFEWNALMEDFRFRLSPRAKGFAFRLSSEGERQRQNFLDDQQREEEMRKLEEYERQKVICLPYRPHETFMTDLERRLDAIDAACFGRNL